MSGNMIIFVQKCNSIFAIARSSVYIFVHGGILTFFIAW